MNIRMYPALAIGCCFALPAAAQDTLDDVFYHFMPMTWRDSAGAADQTRDTLQGADRRLGDFVGMTEGLDYLEQLGVTAVWMNPIHPSPAYHGYQHGPIDQINPRLGTREQFLAFVSAARARNIKVFLDVVCYGIGQDSVYFQSAFNNPAHPFSPLLAFTNASNTTYQGYTFPTWNGDQVGFIHWDLRNPDARDLVTGWTRGWLDPNSDGDPSDGVAGFRLDHTWVTYPNGPDGWGYNLDSFWTPWKQSLRAVNPAVFTFAEQADWSTYGNEFHPVHDAAFTKPFQFAARDALRTELAAPLYDSMAQTVARDTGGPLDSRTFLAIIGDHDVDRLASAIGATSPGAIGRANAAAAVLMLQPFPPIIYAGDELAMLGVKQNYGSDANDIPMREPFKWNAVAGEPMTDYWTLNTQAYSGRFSLDNDGRSVEEQSGVAGSVLETYRTLIRIRRENVGLRRGIYTPIVTDDPGVWAFHKTEPGNTDNIIVAINLRGIPASPRLSLADYHLQGGFAPLTNAATGASAGQINQFSKRAYQVALPPHGFIVLRGNVDLPHTQTLRKADGIDIPSALGLPGAAPATLLATQTNVSLPPDNAIEANQLYVRADPDGLWVGITGNLVSNGSAYVLFIDADPTDGQAVLDTAALSGTPTGLRPLGGTRFDAGFRPEQAFFLNHFNGIFFVDHLTMPAAAPTTKAYVGDTYPQGQRSLLLNGDRISDAHALFDNSNTLGVTTTDASTAATATRGLELFLPYAEFRLAPLDCREVRLSLIASASSGIVSNHTLPPVPPRTSALGLRPNFESIPGNQFATFRLPSWADLTGDGTIDLADFFAFFAAYDVQSIAADVTKDGVVDLADFFFFFEQFDLGCN